MKTIFSNFSKLCLVFLCISSIAAKGTVLYAVTNKTAPLRIVSLAPQATKILFSLGLDEEILGITSFCPKGLSKKSVVGSMLEPNYEVIVALKPDLIILCKDGNRKVSFEKLSSLGLKCYVIEGGRTFEEICGNFIKISKVLGKEKKANEVIIKSQEILNKVRQRMDKKEITTAFWEIGTDPLITTGGKSYINDLAQTIGIINIFADNNSNFFRVSAEEVVQRNPDNILIFAQNNNDKEKKDFWSKFSSMKAVNSKHLFILSPEDVFTPTPETYANSAEYITNSVFGNGPDERRK